MKRPVVDSMVSRKVGQIQIESETDEPRTVGELPNVKIDPADQNSRHPSLRGATLPSLRGALDIEDVKGDEAISKPRIDIPSTIPMVTPFAGYTLTKYKGGSAAAETDESSAILLGGYVDLNMVVANVTYQILNYAGNTDSFVSIGAGIKF